MTEKQYRALVQQISPRSPAGKDYRNAFLVGGLICTLGQSFINLYSALGLDKELLNHLEQHIADCERELDDDAEGIIADQRYTYIGGVVAKAVRKIRSCQSVSCGPLSRVMRSPVGVPGGNTCQ